MGKFTLKRAQKYGAASTALTVIFIAVVVLINILVTVLVDIFPLKLDLTGEKLYEISDETKKVLSSLKEEITIYIFTPENQFNKLLLENIKKYDQLSDKVSYEYVDLTLNPQFAKEYEKGGSSLTASSILVKSDKRYKILESEDLFQYAQDGYTMTGLKAEQKITSAIIYDSNEDIIGIYGTTGHQESEMPAMLGSIAEDNGYVAGSVNLMSEEIPDDAKAVVVYGPTKDFTEEEINKLAAFIDRGNTSILFFAMQNDQLQRLSAYMAEWGIVVNNDLVLDMKNAYGQPYVPMAESSRESSVTENISGTIICPGVSSINLLFSANGSYSTEAFLTTYATSYAKAFTEDITNNFEKAPGDKSGPFIVAAKGTKFVSGKNESVESSIYVYSCLDFASDAVISTGTFSNGDVIASNLSLIGGDKDSVTIAPKYFLDPLMNINQTTATILTALFAVIIPLLLVAAGIIVFVRRKNL